MTCIAQQQFYDQGKNVGGHQQVFERSPTPPAGVPAAGVQEIRAGSKLADVELRQALGSGEPVSLVPAIRIGDAGGLLAALFPVESPAAPDPDNSYSRWLARQPKRQVRE